MIYLIMSGRLGNQLFMYAAAEALRQERGNHEEIIINDFDIIQTGWMKNQLKDYDLCNVRFVSNDYHEELKKPTFQMLLLRLYYDFIISKDYSSKYVSEKKMQPLFNKNGLMICQNGYIMQSKMESKKNIFLLGYFQSENYFFNHRSYILNSIDLFEKLNYNEKNVVQKLSNCNSVCISIKVESNAENESYGVCKKEYWKKAISFIKEKVENPVFYLCSDDIEYVHNNNIIDCGNSEVIDQIHGSSTAHTLCVMSKCKHFIISNSSFSWWAQYLNQSSDKIVVAPSKWMNIDMPIDIYQDGWQIVKV